MKLSFLIFFINFLFVFSFYGFSQDLIVTTEQDSVNCRITKIKKDYIYFTFIYDAEIRNTLLPITNVKEYKQDFFDHAEVSYDPQKHSQDITHFRLCFNGGYSRRIAKTNESMPTELNGYTNKLKSGINFGGEAIGYFSQPFGIGLSYSSFMTSNSMDNINFTDNYGNTRNGSISDDITINFIAPTISARLFNADKSNAVLLNVAIGYMGYTNQFVVVDKYKITGNTLGASLTIGYDIGLSDNFALGVQASILSGTIINYTLDDGTKTETNRFDSDLHESLNRIDLSVGLRFIK